MNEKTVTDDQSDGEASMLYHLRVLAPELLQGMERYWEIPEGNRTGKAVQGQKNMEADFAWPDARILFEVQGAGHSNYHNYRKDWVRHNWLTLWGYRVFYATPDQINANPVQIISWLRKALQQGKRHE